MPSRLLADYFGPSEADAAESDAGGLLDEYLSKRYGGARPRNPEAPPPEAPASGGIGETLLETGLRIGLPILGAVGGGLTGIPGGVQAGGALGGAAGEYLAERVSGQATDWPEVALQGGLSAVPFLGKAKSVGGGILLRGGEAALLGGAGSGARSLLHGEAPDPETMARSAVWSGVVGGVAGGIEGKLAELATRAQRAQAGAGLIEDLATTRQQQTAVADDAYKAATAHIVDQLPTEDRAVFDAFREGRIALARPGPDGLPQPFDPEQYARLTAARDAWEAITQQHEAEQGWLPHQQAGEAAQHAVETGGDPTQAADQAAQAAEAARVRRRVVTERTPLDTVQDQQFAKTTETRRVAQDAAAVQQVLHETEPPTLGRMGLPGEAGTGDALSAANPARLAPSIIDHVQTADDLKGLVNQLAEDNRAMLGEARRGTLSEGQRRAAAQPIIAELADRLGTNPDTFAAGLRKRGEAVNAEQMEALKTVFTSTTADFFDAAKAAAANPGDPQALVQVAKAMNLAKSVMAQKAGAVAEAGRALQTLRGGQQLERLQGKAFETLLKDAGTSPQTLQEIATRAAQLDLEDPVAMTRFLHDVSTASTGDQIFEAWVNGLLSGPRTHVVNNVSNAMALGLRYPETVAAAGVDALRATVTGSARTRFAGEAIADSLAATRGVIGGARAALRSFDTETSSLGLTKLEDVRVPAIPGTAGRMIRTPSRMLVAADEFWKATGYEGALHGQAYREAAMEGAKGPARLARIAQLLSEDRPRLMENAKAETLYRTYQQPSGTITRDLSALRRDTPGGRYVLPFLRTPVNVMGFSLERTPFGVVPLVTKALHGTLERGDAADRIGRMLLGTGLAAATVALAGQGRITGQGPADPGRANALRATGWQPYSLKIGDHYVKYDRVEPLGTVLGLAADTADILRDPLVSPEDVAARVAFGFAKRITDQPFFTGLREVLDALDDPEGKGSSYLKRLASTAIPTVMAQVAQATDPVVRRQRTMSDRLLARVPILSRDLMPLRDIWGAPLERPTGVEALLSPFPRSPVATDPASQEVGRLAMHAGLSINGPRATITQRGITTPLDAEDYDRLSVRAGTLAKLFVGQLVESATYQRLDDDQRRADLVQREFDRARDRAREELKAGLAHQVAASAARGRP